MHIRFMGAARTVTGSRHLLHINDKNILLDCGMFQDKGADNNDRNRNFGFNPTHVNAVILSHAHIDHSGCLPRLVKEGFRGPIYATPATIDLCIVMLGDSAHIQESDVKYINKRRKREGKKELEPLYTDDDVAQTIQQFVAVPYHTKREIASGVTFHFTDAGHILGSAAVNLELHEAGKQTKLTFTGDIGRFHDLILKAPENFPQADYIIAESTYGNRLHDATADAAVILQQVIYKTCVEKKGKVLIPAFSLGRTQEIVYTLNNLWNEGKLPRVKVYVDSPLSINATAVLARHPENYNEAILKNMKNDPDPFGFSTLDYVESVAESKALNTKNEPCIIISASGMIEAGRIKHHVLNNIGDARNTILLVGYCSPGSLGGKLAAGEKQVRIFGRPFDVRAEIVSIGSYSAHADYKEMLEYLSCQKPEKVKKVFLVHGELETQEKYRERLNEAGFADVVIPEQGALENLE